MKAFYAGNIPYPDPYIGKYSGITDVSNNLAHFAWLPHSKCYEPDVYNGRNGSYIFCRPPAPPPPLTEA
jgi:hypothetical protein